MHHHGQHEQVECGIAALPLGAIQSQYPLALGKQGGNGSAPHLLGERLVIQAAAHLLAIGFGVLLSGHEVGHVMKADLACGQQRNERTGEVLREGQVERVEFVVEGLDRIGLGHSELLSRECLTTSR
jgi:hypothetical protein